MELGADTAARARRKRPFPAAALCLALGGVLLLSAHAAILLLSPRFEYGSDWSQRPIEGFVLLLLIAGALYVMSVWSAHRIGRSRAALAWVILVGAGLRAIMFFSAPILEDDFYRYLWDGALVARGENPYEHAPADLPPRLEPPADESGPVIQRVNHPELRTIYPPVAQSFFALAHWLRPWSLRAWKAVLLGVDVAVVLLLLRLLNLLSLPRAWLAAYLWNPLAVKEVYNSAHMDILVLPFVLGAVILAIRERYHWSALLLAFGVGAKLWPLVLVPILLRPLLARPKKLLLATLIFILASGLLLAPLITAGLNRTSGLNAYVRQWEMNDAFFMLVLWGAEYLMPHATAGLAARITVGLLLIGWVGWLIRRRATGPIELCDRCLLAGAGLFLLSPTQFPSYAFCFLPFLVFRARPSLLLLTALLPIYYLRFRYAAADSTAAFDYGIVWLEYLPVWLLIGWEALSRRGRSPGADT